MAWIGAIGLALMAALAAPAGAQVGVVRTVEGQVNVVSGKLECAPRYGLDLDEGDAVRTGPKSWALLNMMDGSKITVRPDTEVRLAAYRYTDDGDSAQNQALLVMARGAVRVAAGRIARGRNTGFRVQTPDATVELRGSDHDVAFVESKSATRGDAPAGSYGKSFAGEAVMRNSHGQVTVRAGQVAYTDPNARAAPRVLTGAEPYFYHWHHFIDRRVAAVTGTADASLP